MTTPVGPRIEERRPTFRSRHYALVFLLPLACLHAPGQSGEVDIHGFVSQGYLDSSEHDVWGSTEDGTFEFSEIGLNIAKRLGENLRIGIQFFARDLGDFDNHEVEINWAVGDYKWRDELGVRIGKIKQSIGIYNQERDVDFLRTSIILPQSVYPARTRAFRSAFEGVELYGHLPGDLDYALYTGAFQLDVNDPATRGFLFTFFGPVPVVDPSVTNDQLLGGALRWNTPIPGLVLATSIVDFDIFAEATLPDGTPISREGDGNRLMTHSIVFQGDRLTLRGEWNQLDNAIQTSAFIGPAGWYAQAEYRVDDRWTLHYRYEEFYTNRDDKDGEAFAASTGLPAHLAWHSNHTFGARLDLGPNWLLKAEWHQIEGTTPVFGFDFFNPDFDLQAAEWSLFAMKATVSF